jgi:cytosine/creatinine deaminase
MAADVNVAFGHDRVMDCWYSVCGDYMQEMARMGLHVAQITNQKGSSELAPCATILARRVSVLGKKNAYGNSKRFK